jgi:hypothetical protein
MNDWIPAKVGTIPMLIKLDTACDLRIGGRVVWSEQDGGRWHEGIVTNVEPLRIDRI